MYMYIYIYTQTHVMGVSSDASHPAHSMSFVHVVRVDRTLLCPGQVPVQRAVEIYAMHGCLCVDHTR